MSRKLALGSFMVAVRSRVLGFRVVWSRGAENMETTEIYVGFKH